MKSNKWKKKKKKEHLAKLRKHENGEAQQPGKRDHCYEEVDNTGIEGVGKKVGKGRLKY